MDALFFQPIKVICGTKLLKEEDGFDLSCVSNHNLGLGGGSSRATTVSLKPEVL